MSEKKIDECVNTVDDHDLEKVAGGGLFSKYSVAEYEAAGVTVINPGYLYNEKYKLTNSGEDLETDWAERAVIFYDYRGRPAWNLEELTYWYWHVYLPEVDKYIENWGF